MVTVTANHTFYPEVEISGLYVGEVTVSMKIMEDSSAPDYAVGREIYHVDDFIVESIAVAPAGDTDSPLRQETPDNLPEEVVKAVDRWVEEKSAEEAGELFSRYCD